MDIHQDAHGIKYWKQYCIKKAEFWILNINRIIYRACNRLPESATIYAKYQTVELESILLSRHCTPLYLLKMTAKLEVR